MEMSLEVDPFYAKFARIDLRGKLYHDFYGYAAAAKNRIWKKLLKNSALEHTINLSVLGGGRYPSDLLAEPSVRGFLQRQEPNNSRLSGSYSVKLNLYDCPWLGGRGLLFGYGMLAGAVGKGLAGYASAGYGVAVELGLGARLELVGALARAKSGAQWGSPLQVRMSFWD
jgi:hypothetical protein